MPEGQQPAPRSSLTTLIIVVLAIGGSGAGVMVYQFLQGGKGAAVGDTSGFDIAVTEGGREPAPSARPQPTADSSLGMLKGGEGMQFGEKDGGNGQAAKPKAAGSFTDSVRAGEEKVRQFAMAYTKKHPAIGQYGRDWMASPELKKLNDDYMTNHDPVAFMKGVAASKDFGALVKKWATNPDVQGFVKEGFTQAPPGVMSSGMSLLKEDKSLKGLVSSVAGSLGLPPAMMAGFTGGGEVDSKQVMGSIMGNNPDVQKAMSNPAVANNPEMQKALKNAGQ